MHKKLLVILFCLVILLSKGIRCDQLEEKWKKMRIIYTNLIRIFSSEIDKLQQKYVLPDWKKCQDLAVTVINGAPNTNFLLAKPFEGIMVRGGFIFTQQVELNYLNYFLSNKNRQLLSKFVDSRFGGLPYDCPQRSCSVNTLGQLFYLANVIEQKDYETIESILEFGAGFGSLCRITKSLLPQVTYINIDLPEFLAIQYLYLSITLPNAELIVHHTAPKQYKPGAIHLIPVFLLEDLTCSTDVFISPFALSECPTITQRLVIEKKFFNASLCYITGQVNGWGTPDNHGVFPNHSEIIEAVKKLYPHNYYHPFHDFCGGNICSYELIGIT